MFSRIYLFLLIIMIMFFVTSCSSNATESSKIINRNNSIQFSSANSSEYSSNIASKAQIISITTLQDLEQKSHAIGSSPGRLALALIINKLDSATDVEDLSKESAQELFDTLRQDAPQKSQTLEGLDQLYGLDDILASEGIYVNFQANNIVSSVSANSGFAWSDKFIKAINSITFNYK